METIRKIRNAHHRDHKPIRQIAGEMNLSRNTVRTSLRSDVTELHYERKVQPAPKLEAFKAPLTRMLDEDARKPKKQRRSALLLFEQVQREGFGGGYDSVRRFVQRWKREAQEPVKAFVPLSFAPGEAFQFDWGYEQIELGGVNVKVKIAQFRLCHSRAPFCVAYLRESLEMVMDAHVQAFGFYGGACRRGIYDNLKTVVSKVLVGKDRVFNRRFQMLASHYLFETVACTPAAGWEKGQVGVDAPVAGLVGVGQGTFADFAANAHVVEFAALGTQTGFDVAQALAIGQLREGHGPELIETGEAFDAEVALIALLATLEDPGRQKVHDLREDQRAGIHSCSSTGKSREEHGRSAKLISSRCSSFFLILGYVSNCVQKRREGSLEKWSWCRL